MSCVAHFAWLFTYVCYNAATLLGEPLPLMKQRLVALLALAALMLAASVGCGEEEGPYTEPIREVQVEADVMEVEVTRVGEREVVVEVESEAMEFPSSPTPVPFSGDSDGGSSAKVQPAPLAQQRIVVHTARMSLVVDDVALTVDQITGIAGDLGGWVVSSDRSSRHSGAIAIRVPAQLLDEAFRQLEALALSVESRAVTSDDVTDEFVDSQSRLASMRATEQRLLSFLEIAQDVEDALLIQEELSSLQLRIEEIEGRLSFLSQTAAYSLIEVSLKLASETIGVDAGGDIAVRVGQPARFRASFTAPQDIEDYSFTWDFGDGSTARDFGSILRPDGKRITATVNHVYEDDRDSPYIVKVELTGTGPGGIAEGSDSLEVSVSHVPTIEVFAGQDQTVEEGSSVDYSASFTRPSELWDYEYLWDFGDGSPTVTGKPEEGSTRIEVTHAYSNYRPEAFTAVLTVSAMSDAGQVSGSDAFTVRVTESRGYLIGSWDVGETTKSAVRAFTALLRVLTSIVIWLAIFSPVVLVVGIIGYFINRSARRWSGSPSIYRRQGNDPPVS